METKEQENLENILDNIHHYVQIYEGSLSDANSDYVLTSFKLAKFVEESFLQAQKEMCLDQFLLLLKTYIREKYSRDVCYPVEFYQKATGNLLKSYFQSNLNACNVAVRMFLALKSESALCEVLTDVIVDSESIKSISEYIILSQNEIDWDDLHCDLLVTTWNGELHVGNSKAVAKAIDAMLNVYKIEHNLKTLLYILSSSQAADDLKELIITKLKPKMIDRTVLSEKFWLALLRKETVALVLQACGFNAKFCELYVDFLVYLVSMFSFEDSVWLLDVNSMCSSLSFTEVFLILSKFYCASEVRLREYSRSRFSEALGSIGTDVWFEVERKFSKLGDC